VKVMLDQIFGENNFQNEIVWKRSTAHTDAKQGSKHYGRLHDVLFFYTGDAKNYTWNQQYTPLSDEYIQSHYTNMDPDGRRFRWDNLTGPGGAAKGNAYFEVLGVTRYWRYSKEKMEELLSAGMVGIPPAGSVPALKRYLDRSKGVALQSVWDDLPPLNSQAKEALGYPTQKPLALLDRILASSSNENDIVLDAFCGCGTALVSAQRMNRQWIGIDISPTACRVMAKRLRNVSKFPEDERLWNLGRGFVVRDLPQTEQQLRKMPPFEFENWAVIALGGIANKVQIGDMGLDGKIYPVSVIPPVNAGTLDFMDIWYPIQVKQKDKAGRPDIDSFEAAMIRSERTKGFFVSFDFTSDALSEIQRFFKQTGRIIVPLTVREILQDEIAMKLA
jgi:hypothetical protein